MSHEPAAGHTDWIWPETPDTGNWDSLGSAMPVYLTSLIGRGDDRERLRALFIEQKHRMVVVTGSGGIGKTRLAVQVATELESHFRHGSRFISFASVPRNTDLDAAFAWHLGLRDTQGQSYRESIRQHLQFREQLLVVDNIEHLPELADLLTFIQQSCAGVTLLVTSRRELQIYGEVIHQMGPLPVRLHTSLLPGIHSSEALDSPAVRLLIERACAVDASVSFTEEDTTAIARICEVLGGIPLALELIAPRLASTSTAMLLDELNETIDRAPHTAREPMAPTISMQETMRLSYDQLDAAQQQGFRVLSIMHGAWTIDDVLPLLTPEISELDAISLIEELVRRSIIASTTGSVEDVRFTINPVLQHFGRTLLVASGEHRSLADRHAQRMIALAEEAEPAFTGKGQPEWLARIDALYNDVRHAYAYLLDANRPVDALRLTTSLWRYAYTRGHYREMRRWIEASLKDVHDHEGLRARALNGVGFLANMTGDHAGTSAAHERALELAGPLRMHREIGISHIGLADIAAGVGRSPEGALHHLELAANAYEQLQEPRGLGSVLTNRGNIQWMQRDLDNAFATHEQARLFYQEAGDIRGMAWSDTNTGRIAAQQGRHHDAVPRLLDALDGYLAIGDGFGIAEILEALTGVAVGLGHQELASTLAGAAVNLREATDAPLKSPDLEEFQEVMDAARRWPQHRTAFANGQRLSPEAAIELAKSITVPDRAAPPNPQQIAHARFGITPREHEVLVLAAEGLTDQQIAERLTLSRRTVQTYISSILHKLKVTSRVSAVRTAHQAGILPTTRR